MNVYELRHRELHPDDWVWITPEERDALLDVYEAAQGAMRADDEDTYGAPHSPAYYILRDALGQDPAKKED